MLTTGDLRKLISENSQIDYNDENKSYVAFSEVIDDRGEEGVRFTAIFTTPSLAARMSPELIQDDATYRYLFLIGYSSTMSYHHIINTTQCSSRNSTQLTQHICNSHNSPLKFSSFTRFNHHYWSVPTSLDALVAM